MNMKRNKCVCGKTKDPNGNCDGSHANTSRIINYLVFTIAFLFSSFSIASSISNEKEVNIKSSNVFWKGEKVTGSHEGNISLKSGVLKFDDKKLTFSDFKTLIINTLQGNLDSKIIHHSSFFHFLIYQHPLLQMRIRLLLYQD